MDALNPIKDEGAGARDAGPLKHNFQHLDSADITGNVKRLATLAARLALRGFSLIHTGDGQYIVSAWNLTFKADGLDAVEQFLQEVAP